MKCGKCEMIELRPAFALEFGITLPDYYELIHCDNCGATYQRRKSKTETAWEFMPNVGHDDEETIAAREKRLDMARADFIGRAATVLKTPNRRSPR
jgi:hypothetical protein